MVVLLIVLVSLLAAYPVAAARRVKVDLILLVDTSDTMTDELEALCREIGAVVADLDRRGVTVNVEVLGVAETRACAGERVTRLFPEGRTDSREDWGVAVADLARHHEWRPDAVRLIIPLSDEGPLDGDPVDSADERAIRTAIEAARANDVTVSPVLGVDFNPEVEPLARDLAQKTDGRVFISRNPKDDLAGGLRELVLAIADRVRAATTVLEAIPTPLDIVFDGQVISTNLVLAILLTLVLGVASAVLGNLLGNAPITFDANRSGRLVAAAIKLGRAAERLLSPGEWSRLSGRPRRLLVALQLIFFLALMALLGLFLQPTPEPVSWRGLGLGLGLALALLLLNLIHDGGQYWLAQRTGETPTLRLRPAAPVAALVGVLLSRSVGFVPGYFYGRVAHCDLDAREPGETTPAISRPVRIVLITLGAVGAAGLLFWVLTAPTSLLLDFVEGLKLPKIVDNILTGLLGAALGFFSLCFFLAWQMLLFELLPLFFTGGGLIYQRNRLLWAIIAFVILFVLLHTLVNPFGTIGELLESRGLILLLLAAFLYSALAVGVWLYLALRTGGSVTRDWNQGQRTTVMAISLLVLWGLGACAGLVILVMGLLG
jgi:hypothetical protein